MRMTKHELTDHTLAVWQSRTSHRLTNEDAREITENITGFFAILAEWSGKERHLSAVDVASHADVTAGEGHEA
jgi:hypothetical protein